MQYRKKPEETTTLTTETMTVKGKGKSEGIVDNLMTEAALQKLTNNYLRIRGLLYFHDEKGSGRGKRHRSGWPDCMVYRATKLYHGLAIELKTKDGVVSEEQKALMLRLRQEGWFVCVCRNFPDVKAMIDVYLE
jgi:hypothetical protein